MKEKNTVSNNKCPEDFKTCRFYNSNQPEESRCIKDSNIGYCVEEYFELYGKSEVIKDFGDSK